MQLGTRGPITIAGVALSAGLVLVLVLLFKQGSAGVATAAATVACTITGTDGNDVLKGTVAPDVICGGAGNDVLIGGPGDDMLVGGPGEDTASFRAAAGPVIASLASAGAARATTFSSELRTSSDHLIAINCPAATDGIASPAELAAMSSEALGGATPSSGAPVPTRSRAGAVPISSAAGRATMFSATASDATSSAAERGATDSLSATVTPTTRSRAAAISISAWPIPATGVVGAATPSSPRIGAPFRSSCTT
jgi:hypothetical protein